MASSIIKRKSGIHFEQQTGSATISTSGGNGTITLDFTAPSNALYLGTVVRFVSASNSANAINTLVPLEDYGTRSVYRVVSSAAQTITITARKFFLV